MSRAELGILAERWRPTENTFRVLIDGVPIIDRKDPSLDGKFVAFRNPKGIFRTENYGEIEVDLGNMDRLTTTDGIPLIN